MATSTQIKRLVLFIALTLPLLTDFSEARAEPSSIQNQRSGLDTSNSDPLASGKWEFNTSFTGLLPSTGQGQKVSEAHLPLKFFIANKLALGLDSRYWAGNFFPLSATGSNGPTWAFGPTGEIYIYQRKNWSGGFGGSLLWATQVNETLVSPVASVKYFIWPGVAVGASYHYIKTLRSYVLSMTPDHEHTESHSITAELSVFL